MGPPVKSRLPVAEGESALAHPQPGLKQKPSTRRGQPACLPARSAVTAVGSRQAAQAAAGTEATEVVPESSVYNHDGAPAPQWTRGQVQPAPRGVKREERGGRGKGLAAVQQRYSQR